MTTKVEQNFYRFRIQGIEKPLALLPAVSAKTHQIMEQHGFSSPKLEARELKTYDSKVHSLIQYEKDRKVTLQLGLLCLAISVALVAGGILGMIVAAPKSGLLIGSLLGVIGGFIMFMFGIAGILDGTVYEFEREREIRKELEQLKPKAQHYVEDFVRYYQIHGQELRTLLEKARTQFNPYSDRRFSEENRAQWEKLSEALAEIVNASWIAQQFGEPGEPGAPLPQYQPTQDTNAYVS